MNTNLEEILLFLHISIYERFYVAAAVEYHKNRATWVGKKWKTEEVRLSWSLNLHLRFVKEQTLTMIIFLFVLHSFYFWLPHFQNLGTTEIWLIPQKSTLVQHLKMLLLIDFFCKITAKFKRKLQHFRKIGY